MIDNYQKLDNDGNHLEYGGAYWGIRVKINDYDLMNPMVKDNVKTASLQNIRDRLKAFSSEKQGYLINWGHALTDTALRRWYYSERQDPGSWPIPEYALDK